MMADSPSTRRDFLKGKSAADVLGEIGAGGSLHGSTPAAPDAACLLSLTRRAMACDFQVQLPTDRDRNQTQAAMAALDLVDELEDQLSVYRDHSQIMRLNRAAQLDAAHVEPDLFALLEQCDRLYQQTDGAFDATTGPLSRVWGFFERKGRLPDDEELAKALELVGWRHLQLDHDAQTMRILKPGVEVNFNGIGKGYALDAAAAQMQGDGVADLLMHGGRSTLVARGNRPENDGTDGAKPGWGVGLRHPLRPQHHIAEFDLVDAAFSTSGSATQGFVHQGQRYGHILDPRTGQPATGMHSVSVIAPTGAEADALSTAFFVMGYEAAERYCRRNPEVGALMVLAGERPNQVEIRPLNLPQDRWRQLAQA